ncbi:MAG: hypothetical protein ACW9XH_08115 [Candidatus Nitrosopumilus sp. bin_32a]
MMDENQLKEYYSKLSSEFQLSHGKKDTVTNWSLTIVLASLAAYFGLSIEFQYPAIMRLALSIGTFMIVTQFFVTSLLAYGYLSKWGLIRGQIEKYWIGGNPTLKTIIKLIETYDHKNNLSVNKTRMLRASLISGFAVILGIPIGLITYEISKIDANNVTEFHLTAFIILTIFIGYSILSVVKYQKFNYINPDTILK